jgi:two-component system sensor histidine kinase MtrB
MNRRGVRGRLILTLIGLVALTCTVLGIGAYAYVATSLRAQQLDAARELTTYNVAVLAVERLPSTATRTDLQASHLLDGFAARGILGTIVDFGDGNPFASNLVAAGVADRLSPSLRSIVAAGDVGYERTILGDRALLIIGARRPPSGPAFYFLFDASGVEDAILRLGQALLVGGLILVLIAAVAGRLVARGLLRPVGEAASAAERIADGDLAARLNTEPGDEFGQWAASFNRMAATLETHVADLHEAQAREQRFVADVSHELRTPLTALVTEASLLRDHLATLPDGGRRVGELLVADIGRLRTLVDDLMEVSRFDAGSEQTDATEFELAAFVRAMAAVRLPDAQVSVPDRPTSIVTDRRRLERILANLLDNARLHAGGQEVEIEARLEPDADGRACLVLSVSDRGPGVPPAELPHLFDRFRKADPSRHLGGSGLGLAIAREHARLLGGTLTGFLRPGGGLRAELRIPVTQPLPSSDGVVMDESHAAGLAEPRRESGA